MSERRRVVLAFDKFRGTATQSELAEASAEAVETVGAKPRVVFLADGGEGTLESLGGANRETVVSGPLGAPVKAKWVLRRGVACIEMAQASGIGLVGGIDGNDPMLADTKGTGELIARAISVGAKTVYVTMGGSASTDGGLAALSTMPSRARLSTVQLYAATDVTTKYLDAAAVYGPQKGASAAQVRMLSRRLAQARQLLLERYEVDVADLVGSGAAGGLAGALAAVGGTIVSGFDMVAQHARLDELLLDADLVITGEGKLDVQSFEGKVVGGVCERARAAGVRVGVVVGTASDVGEAAFSADDSVQVRSLTDIYGASRAHEETLLLVREQVAALVQQLP